MFTVFRDMHTSGIQKTEYKFIVIEAPLAIARFVFEKTLNISPDYSACNCCGPDFSYEELENLDELSLYLFDIKEKTLLIPNRK